MMSKRIINNKVCFRYPLIKSILFQMSCSFFLNLIEKYNLPLFSCNNFNFRLRLIGVLSVDVDVSDIDVNQCDQMTMVSPAGNFSNSHQWQMDIFLGTHKCHNHTSKVIFHFSGLL